MSWGGGIRSSGFSDKHSLRVLPIAGLIAVCVFCQHRTGVASAFYDRGITAFCENKYDEAIVHFKAALVDSQTKPASLYYLGLSLYHAGRHDEALKALRSTGEVEPDFKDYVYHYYLGAIFHHKRIYSKAQDEFQACVDEHPASLLATKARTAIEQLRSLPASAGRDTLKWYTTAAEAGLAAGDPSWAEDYAVEAFVLAPHDPDVRVTLARVKLALGLADQAEQLLTGLDQSKTEVILVSAALAAAKGRYRDALDRLEAADNLQPKTAREYMLRFARSAAEKQDRVALDFIVNRMSILWPDAPQTQQAQRIAGKATEKEVQQ